MRRDPKAFRERFAAWKNGEQVYDNGRPIELPKYGGGKDSISTFVSQLGPLLYKKLQERNIDDVDSVYSNMISQLAYESNYGTSRVAREQHNYGGYGWNGKTYTTFKDDADFIDHYLNIMTGRHKSSLNAKDPSQFAESLKKSGYYEDTVNNYRRNLLGMVTLRRIANLHHKDNINLYTLDPIKQEEPILPSIDDIHNNILSLLIPRVLPIITPLSSTRVDLPWRYVEARKQVDNSAGWKAMNHFLTLDLLKQVMDGYDWQLPKLPPLFPLDANQWTKSLIGYEGGKDNEELPEGFLFDTRMPELTVYGDVERARRQNNWLINRGLFPRFYSLGNGKGVKEISMPTEKGLETVSPEFYVLAGLRPGGDIIAPITKNQIKNIGRAAIKQATKHTSITPKNAASITPEQWTTAQDAAIAGGDMAEAQRLRDLHFKVSAPNTKISNTVYHGTDETFNQFDRNKIGTKTDYGVFGEGFYFSPTIEYARQYGDNVMPIYLDIENPYVGVDAGGILSSKYIPRDPEKAYQSAYEAMLKRGKSVEEASKIANRHKQNAIDGNRKAEEIRSKDYDGVFANTKQVNSHEHQFVAFNPEQIKSADAITYDDNGVRIPLGERDNFNLNDIRWELLPFVGITGAAVTSQKGYTSGKDRLPGYTTGEDGGFLNWLKNAVIGASVADAPAVATASGWHNEDGLWRLNRTAADELLGLNLSVLSTFSPTHPLTAATEKALLVAGRTLKVLRGPFVADVMDIETPIAPNIDQLTREALKDYTMAGGGKRFNELLYQNYLRGYDVPGLRVSTPRAKKDIPEEMVKIYKNSVEPRLKALREWMNAEDISRGIDNALSEGYSVYDDAIFNRAGHPDWEKGFYNPKTGRISIRKGYEDFAVGHEVRHRVDDMRVPLVESEENLLNASFTDDFKNLSNTVEELKGVNMSEEMVTTNFDGRKKLLGRDVLKRVSVPKQNKMIDEATYEEMVESMAGANGYGKRYVEALINKYGRVPDKLIKAWKESYKHVGMLTGAAAVAKTKKKQLK